MLKALKRFFKRLFWLSRALAVAFVAWLIGYGWLETLLSPTPLQFSLKEGSSLRSAARQMNAAGRARRHRGSSKCWRD